MDKKNPLSVSGVNAVNTDYATVKLNYKTPATVMIITSPYMLPVGRGYVPSLFCLSVLYVRYRHAMGGGNVGTPGGRGDTVMHETTTSGI